MSDIVKIDKIGITVGSIPCYGFKPNKHDIYNLAIKLTELYDISTFERAIYAAMIMYDYYYTETYYYAETYYYNQPNSDYDYKNDYDYIYKLAYNQAKDIIPYFDVVYTQTEKVLILLEIAIKNIEA